MEGSNSLSESTESKSTGTSSVSRRRRRRNQSNGKRSASAAFMLEGVGTGGVTTSASASDHAHGNGNGSEAAMSYQVLDFQPASYLLQDNKSDNNNQNNNSNLYSTNHVASLGSPGPRESPSQPPPHPQPPHPPHPNRLYGLDIPPVPIRNICAACHGTRNQELRDDTVLLCDGIHCGAEFHVPCCVPALVSDNDIPVDNWYCIDCSTTGATITLQQYLEANDDTKADYATWDQYRESLWDMDFQEEATASPVAAAVVTAAAAAAANTTAASTTKKPRRPKSELDRAYQSHELAMRLANKGSSSSSSNKNSHRQSQSKKARALKNSRIRNSHIMAHPETIQVPACMAAAITMADMDTTGEQHRHPDHFLGRPVRLYNPAGNTYHTGRIVDWRETSSWSSNSTTNKKQGKSVGSSNDNSVSVPTMKEYLVRFTAGMDERKTAYQHWIVLEEHALAVGTSLIWGSFEQQTIPAILWLRTARELVPVQHLLEENLGQILYEDSHVALGGSASSSQALTVASKEAIILQWKRHTGVAMARSYGEEKYQLLNLESESVDLFNPDAQRLYGSTQERMKVLVALVMAEWHEQEAVREWHKMKLGNPMGHRVLTSHDEYALGSLVPRNHPNIAPAHAAPCALVPVGLDRLKTAKILERQGVTVTKDLAAGLTATIAPVDVAKYNREKREARGLVSGGRGARDGFRKVASIISSS